MKPSTIHTERSVRELVMPAFALCEEIPEIIGQMCGTFRRGEERHGIPRFVVAPSYWVHHRPQERIGFISGISGTEDVAPRVLLRLVERLALELEPPYNLLPVIYPVVNPSGFEAGTHTPKGGPDLNKENWASSQEPEVFIMERELRNCGFQGLVLLQETDDAAPSVALHDTTLHFERVLCALSAAAGISPKRVGFGGTLSDHGCCAAFHDLPKAPWLVALRIPKAAAHDDQMAEDALCFLESFLAFYARRHGHLPGAGSILHVEPATAEALLHPRPPTS